MEDTSMELYNVAKAKGKIHAVSKSSAVAIARRLLRQQAHQSPFVNWHTPYH